MLLETESTPEEMQEEKRSLQRREEGSEPELMNKKRRRTEFPGYLPDDPMCTP